MKTFKSLLYFTEKFLFTNFFSMRESSIPNKLNAIECDFTVPIACPKKLINKVSFREIQVEKMLIFGS